VVSGAFEGLRHEEDLDAFAGGLAFGVFYVADEHQVAQAVDFGIGAEDGDGAVESRAEKASRTSESIFSRMDAMRIRSWTS